MSYFPQYGVSREFVLQKGPRGEAVPHASDKLIIAPVHFRRSSQIVQKYSSVAVSVKAQN